MKRLIIVAGILLSFFVIADDAPTQAATQTTESQSSSEASSSNDDDVSISIANVHHINLDTTQIDGGGNWLNKRMWYERAQTMFDEIRVLVSSATDLRIQFVNEVNAVGQKIDAFYDAITFTKQELDDKFKEIAVALGTEQKIIGDLSAQERDLQTTIKQEIDVIGQVGKNIETIPHVDAKIDDTLMQALKTIDECRDYETKSWDAFKSIGKELDDKKARNLYYQMSNYKQNIDQKITYLRTKLLPYLHNILVAKIDSNIAKINQSLADLKAKGVDLQKIMSKTQEDDLTALQEREKEASELAVRKAIEQEEEKSQRTAQRLKNQFDQELDQVRKSSWGYTFSHYYDLTLGAWFTTLSSHCGGFSLASIGSVFTGFFKNYSYPVITYCYHAILAAQVYMQELVQSLMSHYGGSKPVKKKRAEAPVTAEPSVESTQEPKIEKSEPASSTTQEPQAASSEQAESPSAASSDQQAAPQPQAPSPTSTDQQESAVSPTQDATQTPLTAAHPAQPAQAAADQPKAEEVAVQGLQDEDDQEQLTLPASKLYALFKAFLDFIGTIFMSLYQCVLMFFNLIFKCVAYIAWMN